MIEVFQTEGSKWFQVRIDGKTLKDKKGYGRIFKTKEAAEKAASLRVITSYEISCSEL